MVSAATFPKPKNDFQPTELGLIPSDWSALPLSDFISSLDAGVSVNSSDQEDVEADLPCILKTSCVSGGYFIPQEAKPILRGDLMRAKTKPESDSIIISRMNTPALVGECGYVGRDYDNLYLPDRLWLTRHRRSLSHSVRWLAYVLSAPALNKTLKDAATGTSGSMKNIPKPALLAVKVPTPPTKQEQEAIAEALSDADALIESLEALIAKKRAIKQGAMQDLLTGRKRLLGFSGQWNPRKLGELGTFFKGSGVRKDEAQSGDLPCVRYGEIYTSHHDIVREFQSFISREVASTAAEVTIGDILFAGSGETKDEIGKAVALVDCEKAYAGGDIVILRPAECDPRFLGYALNHHNIQRQKSAKGQGDAVVHISASALAAVTLELPTFDEQTAIGQVIDQMDAEIALLDGKLNKARQIKQGMMQELLTGRVRLV